jgi:nucleoside-diphosphate-sugar epimerase
VIGGAGFIGRWLVKELLDQGVDTTATVRTPQSIAALTEWLERHDAATGSLRIITGDTSLDSLGLDPANLSEVREIYNVTGAYRFGMHQDEARAANVDGSRRVVEFAATLPALVRLIHLSGYRVGGQDPGSVPGP